MIPNSRLRVLLAVVELAQDGWPVTIRRIMKRCGYTSMNAVQPRLIELQAMGLIHRERYRSGVIRPTCTVELIPNEPESVE